MPAIKCPFQLQLQSWLDGACQTLFQSAHEKVDHSARYSVHTWQATDIHLRVVQAGDRQILNHHTRLWPQTSAYHGVEVDLDYKVG